MINSKNIACTFLTAFCFFSCFATGYGFGDYATEPIIRDIALGTIGSLILFLVLASWRPRLASNILLIYVLSTGFYFPIGWQYGAPTYQITSALMETNVQESIQFLRNVPFSIWLLQITFLFFGIITWRWCCVWFLELPCWPKKIKQQMVKLVLALLFIPPIINVVGQFYQWRDGRIFSITLIGFYVDLAIAPKLYWQAKREMLAQFTQAPTWHIQSVKPKYQNYVIVIGESARKDYLNAYGFNLPNTPFLSKTNGLLIDGYVSTASYTLGSIPSTLSMRGKMYNNVISMAKMAGFSTYWLSNQGMFGDDDSGVSAFAMLADERYFTQRKDYKKGENIHDSELLKPLQTVLKQPSEHPKLIILHLIGSHAEFCKRLKNPVQFHFKNKQISCYVSSILETDNLLSDIINMLKVKNEPYSLIYFSDHGLRQQGYGSEQTFIHGDGVYEGYSVPFARLSSDDTTHTLIKVQRSAFSFLQGFSQWTGIKVSEFSNGYDFFGTKPDLPSSNNNLQEINQMSRDKLQE